MSDTAKEMTTMGLIAAARRDWDDQRQRNAIAAEAAKAKEEQIAAERKSRTARQIANHLARWDPGVQVEIDPDDLIRNGDEWLWPITPQLAIGPQGSALGGRTIFGLEESAFLGYLYSLSDLGRLIRETDEAARVEKKREPSEDEVAWQNAWLARRPVPPGYTRIEAARERGILLTPSGGWLQLRVWGLKDDRARGVTLGQSEAQDLLNALWGDGKCRLDANWFAVCENLSVQVFLDEGDLAGYAVNLDLDFLGHGQFRDALQAWLDYLDEVEAWSEERYDSGAAQPVIADDLPF